VHEDGAVDPRSRARVPAFANIGGDRGFRRLCRTPPTEDDGFVVCAFAAVRAIPHGFRHQGEWEGNS
jgi:hypothetical protein